jgi:hypothetical protein
VTDNPYESPKAQNQPTRSASNLVPAAGCLLAASVPAAFFCGGITCYSAGLAGEAAQTEAGWLLGIPLALLVAALVPLLTYLALRRRQP